MMPRTFFWNEAEIGSIRHSRNEKQTGAEMRYRNCLWDRYWGSASFIIGQFFSLSLVPFTDVFTKVISAPFFKWSRMPQSVFTIKTLTMYKDILLRLRSSLLLI